MPKTTPAAALAEALGEHVPDDGSRDLIMLGESTNGPYLWPTLFVDSVALVDPVAAATVYVNDVRCLS